MTGHIRQRLFSHVTIKWYSIAFPAQVCYILHNGSPQQENHYSSIRFQNCPVQFRAYSSSNGHQAANISVQQSKHYNNFVIFLSELRKSIRFLGISLILLTIAIFFLSTGLISVFQEHLREKLYFFSVAGPFLAHVKVAFFGAVYTLMPLLMYVLWKALGNPFAVTGNRLMSPERSHPRCASNSISERWKTRCFPVCSSGRRPPWAARGP